MVTASSKSDCKDEKKSRGLSPSNGHVEESEKDGDGGMRIGKAYQAEIPDLLPTSEQRPEQCPEKAMLVWAPSYSLPEDELEEYLWLAKDKYGYNAEQALGMLFWHRHDLEKATADLANFTPFPDEWTTDDKVLFEQAFQFHGKSFHRIRQMGTDVGSEATGDHSEDEDEKGSEDTKVCANCTVPSSNLKETPKGLQCLTCYSHWKKIGTLRPTVGPMKRDRQLIKHKRHPPKGMYINYEDLMAMVSASSSGANAGQHILKHMENEVIALKRQVQNNKVQVSARKQQLSEEGISPYRPPTQAVRLNAKWSNDELLLAVQGVRQFGKNFKAIAEIIGNKTENHVRSFFVTYRKRYNLDSLLKEWEAEHGPSTEPKEEKSEAESSNTSTSRSTPVKTQ